MFCLPSFCFYFSHTILNSSESHCALDYNISLKFHMGAKYRKTMKMKISFVYKFQQPPLLPQYQKHLFKKRMSCLSYTPLPKTGKSIYMAEK